MLTQVPSDPGLDAVRRSCSICNCVDSWAKLYVLMWFCEHPSQQPTAAELAQRLCLGDTTTCRHVLESLQGAGFFVEKGGRWALSKAPEVQACLDYLRRCFLDPLARQELIERIRRTQAPQV